MTKSLPKYIKVKNKIKEDIKNGKIVDKLPGERVLATEFDVAYMTVRKALMELQEEGILHRSTTKGTYVSHSKMSPKVTKNIGFFLDDKIDEGISSPYYSLIFKALKKAAKDEGYNLLIYSDTDDMNPINDQKRIDGSIICCFPRIEYKIQELKKFIPIVLLDNMASDKSIPSVTIDNFNSVFDSTKYLISLGHERIGFISGLMDSDICKDRLHGYLSALNNNNLHLDKALVYKGDYSYASGEKAARYFLSQKVPPSAIMCANDSMAIGAMKIIQELGFSIPKNISVVGFDDIEVASRVFPTLTTNAAPIDDIARKSLDLLISAINGKNIEFQHIILPAKLVLRDSSTNIK
ncbi:MAG: GntR family transcriptional regulator [Candidatus Cloacimonetes bacterium]|nr:GntR family transcriptional regulator [Candidatus Cloacimonadota bacterium]